MFRSQEQTLDQNWDGLRRHLAGHGLRLGEGVPRQFAGGVGNLNYLIELNEAPAVLRRPPPGPLPPGANDMAREHRTLAGLAPIFSLAPAGLHFCEDLAVLGAPFQIIEYRAGTIYGSHAASPGQSAGKALCAALLTTLARLHSVDPVRVWGEAAGRETDFAGRTLRGWRKRAARLSAGEAIPALAQIESWLEKRIPPSARPAVIHNDFKLDNMVFDEADGTSPVALLDWDMAVPGDPMFDLGTLLAYWVEPGDPEPLHALRQMPADRWPGFPGRDAALAQYRAAVRVDPEPLHFYYILALYKLSIVALQLEERAARGEPTGRTREDWAALAKGVATFGWDRTSIRMGE